MEDATGKHYAGIVKNVDYGSENEDDDDENDGAAGGEGKKVMYEVEFSDGEIWDVDPKNMFENVDDW